MTDETPPAGDVDSGTHAPVVVDPVAASLADDGQRYETRSALGQGGMGAVLLCRDRRIGRDVAVKAVHRALLDRPNVEGRFLREAQVQGQLEHPAIVPVYDIGSNDEGGLYFTMKRVRGTTLESIIDRLLAGDEDTTAKHSRHKLLRAFATACLCIEYAHSRGVLHRDLKPENIMLGDFGEVYVLDWGVAKLVGGEDDLPSLTIDSAASSTVETQHGKLVGTPHYMAPEQVDGPVGELDARTDVYALGAILFEILTFDRLKPVGELDEVLQATLQGVEARASVRLPELDVPPELEQICVRATATDPTQRYATVRELHDALERFIVGDRDAALRRALAVKQLERARRAVDDALAHGATEDTRSKAVRLIGRVIALDPKNADALDLMARLLVEPPLEMPKAAEEALERARLLEYQASAKAGVAVYVVFGVTHVLALYWLGVEDWGLVAMGFGPLAIGAGVASFAAVHDRLIPALSLIPMCILMICGMVMSRMFGPLVYLPPLVVTAVAVFGFTAPGRGLRAVIIGFGVAMIALPLGLELAGLIPSSYVFHDELMCIKPQLHAFPPGGTLALLSAGSLFAIVGGGMVIGGIRDAMSSAEKRAQMQTWHLEQLVPASARPTEARVDPDAT